MGSKNMLDYENVVLIPKKGIVRSRKDCDTSFKLGKYIFDFPLWAVNMKSVVDIDTGNFLLKITGSTYTIDSMIIT